MKVSMVILGTRGDVQPMVALAIELMKRNHEVIFCAPPEHEGWVTKLGVPFMAFGPPIRKKIRENPSKQKGGVAVKIDPKAGKKMTLDQMTLLPEIIRGSDLVLGTGIVLGVHTAADAVGAVYRLVAFYPVILGTTPEDPLKSRMMFGFGRFAINAAMKGFINKTRKQLNLKPIRDAWENWMGEEVILASDPEVNKAREGVAFRFKQTGFMLMPSAGEIPPALDEFISRGTPPVYIGFGSNPIEDPGKYSGMFSEVQRETGQRLIVSKGWAELPDSDDQDIHFVDEIPFDLVFPKLAAVVYHGGTGTMASVVRAGIPQAIFPFMGDQFDNRKQALRLGIAPETCDFKEMTGPKLSGAINKCLKEPVFGDNARILAQKLAGRNGVVENALFIEGLVRPKGTVHS